MTSLLDALLWAGAAFALFGLVTDRWLHLLDRAWFWVLALVTCLAQAAVSLWAHDVFPAVTSIGAGFGVVVVLIWDAVAERALAHEHLRALRTGVAAKGGWPQGGTDLLTIALTHTEPPGIRRNILRVKRRAARRWAR